MANELIGRWVLKVPGQGEVVYEFRGDGTYSYNSPTVGNSGKYEVSGDSVTFPQMGTSIRVEIEDGNKLVMHPPGYGYFFYKQ